jgi:hypothetical protein
MKRYHIAVLSGDLTRPLIRSSLNSIDSLHLYCLDYDSSKECSVIVEELDLEGNTLSKKVYFGSIANFFKQLNKRP